MPNPRTLQCGRCDREFSDDAIGMSRDTIVEQRAEGWKTFERSLCPMCTHAHKGWYIRGGVSEVIGRFP